ncbi:hypothetical protein FGM00_00700 [Aggregatimonas sangjinii]|uniref:Uncharacterized protein n=1 Tax=Aggregatimonas sangjinii TaxID=2583587 RepID=A0A5B7SKY7_9FLAO|nr:hypothetical protein [Aggregatimonas sangjinii]QCW98711.1 hypothetical protein FGM00_00700 [Aggregatimonas sangjinii]
MVKNFILAVLSLAATGLYAQDGTGSPYSYFGIGENRATGAIENQMMGGIGVYTDSIHVNLQNPASYGMLGLKSVENGRLSVYTGALSRNEVRLESFTDTQSSSSTNLEYLALGFNLTKGLGIGFGIMPLSSVGYNIVSESTNGSGATVRDVYQGEGGINRVFFSAGYEVFRDFSVGVTANFNFGRIVNENVQSVEDVQFGTRDIKESEINGLDFNYAIQYNPMVTEKHRLFASVRVNTQGNLTSENSREISSLLISEGRTIESIDVNLDAAGLRNTGIKIPTTTTLGVGFGEDKKWFLVTEYSFQGFKDFSNEFLEDDNVAYQNASTVSLGGFYIPDYDAFNGYLKRVTYRAGMRFGNTGMVVNTKEIKNLGITFGVGLPLGRSLPNINIGFELGRRGTSTADLVEENYAKINVGFSFNDLWFRKRKIN